MLPASNPEKPITIVLFGRTGVGKSSLANKMIGKERFAVGHDLDSKTEFASSETFTLFLEEDQKLLVKIVDTPGFGDNRLQMTNAELLARTLNFLKSLEDGLNIAIFCLSAARARIDKHDMQELEMLRLLLGEDLFEHVCIAITQADTLIPEQRKKVYQNYKQDLPRIFQENGLPAFTQKILFADFDRLKESFLEPLMKLLRTATSYVPKLAEEIDTNDQESINKFLAKPEMKKMMAHYESLAAEQKKQIESMQQVMGKQAEKLKQQTTAYQQERETTLRNLEIVNQQLKNQEIQNESIRQEARKFQQQEQIKLDSLTHALQNLNLQGQNLQQALAAKDANINALNARIAGLQAVRLGRKKGCNIF